MSYVIHTPLGSFCSACQSPLGCEEADFEVCDTCGGEGIGGDDEEYDPCDGFSCTVYPNRPIEDIPSLTLEEAERL